MKEQDRLVEVDGAIFDRVLLEHSFGFENLDVVGRESFVNHTHFEGQDRVSAALELAESWKVELLRRWPAYTFRLYWHDNEVEDEIIIRFHRVYPGILNWCDDPLPDLRITEISA